MPTRHAFVSSKTDGTDAIRFKRVWNSTTTAADIYGVV